MVQVKITKTVPVATDGIHITVFMKGEIHNLPERLADLIVKTLEAGTVIPPVEEKEPEDTPKKDVPKKKKEVNKPENKAEPKAPENKATTRRRK